MESLFQPVKEEIELKDQWIVATRKIDLLFFLLFLLFLLENFLSSIPEWTNYDQIFSQTKYPLLLPQNRCEITWSLLLHLWCYLFFFFESSTLEKISLPIIYTRGPTFWFSFLLVRPDHCRVFSFLQVQEESFELSCVFSETLLLPQSILIFQ